MRYFTLWKAGMKKQRGSLCGIFLLMLIISMSLGSVLTIRSNSAVYIKKEMERLQIGDILYWAANVQDLESILSEIEGADGTKSVRAERVLMAKGEVNQKESSAEIQGMVYLPKESAYSIFNKALDDYEENPEALKDGEIYVPISFCSIYGAVAGDALTYKKGNVSETYKIKGFFEDPLMGSSMMGMKRFLMTASDQQKFMDKLQEQNYLIHVFWDKQDNQTLKEYQNYLNEVTTVDNYAVLVYQRDTLNNFMLLLQNIFFGFLVAFVSVLLLTAIIVIGHSISSSMEQDYVDMGILKAVGCKNSSLVMIQMVQYLLVTVLGLLMGLLLAPEVVTLVNRIIMTVTGIVISNQLPLLNCVEAFGALTGILAVYILFKASSIGKITPICAIRGGKKDIFFSNKLFFSIHKRALSFWLGLRQLGSGRKQYLSTCFITVFMVFFLSLCGRIQAWLGPDGSGMMNTMGMASVDGRTYDFAVHYKDEEMQREAEEIIDSYTKTLNTYESITTSGQLNHSDYLLSVISNPEYFHIVRGRTCTYDNEIVITESVSKETGLQIGDWVTVSVGDSKEDFMISGFHQCANDMGANFAMGKAAYEKLTDGLVEYYVNYIIEQQEQEEKIVDALNEKFGTDIQVDENTWSGVDGIVSAAGALEFMMYVICAIFIIVVISMTGSKILYKEQRDLGIYKSLGFKSNVLRVTFAVRFGLVAMIGSAIGVVISVFATDSFVGAVLRSFGISDFSSDLGVVQMVKPAVCVVMFFLLFSYVCAGRIEKTDVGILIVE